MPRPPRHDYPGATHHVFVRGVARTVVAVDDADYERSLRVLAKVASRFDLVCHAWCLLPNHAHLLVTSQHGNLSRAMHWFGTCTAQAFNLRHDRSGHLYQGRFGSRLVRNDRYFLQLVQYVALNPVRAGLCGSPADWPWSSYSATAGLCPAPRFLDTQAFLGLLETDDYVAWVAQGLASRGTRRARHSAAASPTDARGDPRGGLEPCHRVGALPPRIHPGGDSPTSRRECLSDLSPAPHARLGSGPQARGQARTMRARPRCCVVGSSCLWSDVRRRGG